QAASERVGRFAAVAENCRRYLGQRAVAWAIREKRLIGDPRMFFALRVDHRPPREGQPWRWRADRFLGGCGMVMDSGAHWVDTLRYFFGEVETVYAQVKQFERRMLHHPERGAVPDAREDMWTAVLTFANGMVGTWAWTIAAPGKGGSLITFHGSEGSIEGPPGEVFHPFCFSAEGGVDLKDGTHISIPELKQMYLEALSPDERERLFPYGIHDGFVIEIHDFVEAIRQGRPPELDVVEGMKSKAVAEAIYESAHRGQAVRVADVLSGAIDDFQRDIDRHWGL
ncbi:MAG TPA: Gfo/Idh/MocA family oxidoreductase, partial [Limnochordia bacterium]